MLSITLMSCNDSPIQPIKKIELREKFINRTVAQLDKNASICQNPATPNGVRDATNWRYGCFCGPEYPSIDKNLTKVDRIARYFEIGPKDEIDKACRDHDICWIEFGDGDPACTHIYTETLDKLFEEYMQARKSLPEKIDGKRPFSKCTKTILDQLFAFSTIFAPTDYDNYGDQISAKIARLLFATPTLGATALVFSGSAEYPGPEDYCNTPRK